MLVPLSHIKPGTSARIEFLGNDELMAGRLRDLGFEPDAVVSCVLQKARGNIAAYLVRGAVIALREEDSRFVFVEPRIFEIKESLKPPAEVPDKAVCEVTAVHEVTS